MNTRSLAPLLLLVACAATDDDPVLDKDDTDAPAADTADPEPDPTGTGDTAEPTGPDTIDWGTLAFAFQLGWDPQAGAAHAVILDDGAGGLELPPSLDLHLGSPTWSGDPAQTSQYCTISFPLEGAINDPTLTSADPRLWTSLVVTGDAITDCFDGTPGDLDPDVYGSDLHTYLQSLGDWGVGIGEIDATSYGYLAPALTTPDLTPTDLIGGSFFLGGLFDPADVDEAFGFAWQVEPDFTVTVDPSGFGSALPSSTVHLGQGQLTQAWYDVTSLYIYTLQ